MKFSLTGAAMAASMMLGSVPGLQAAETLEQMKAHYVRPPSVPFPDENPYSDAKYRLGRTLFFDPRLSGSEVTSCATCHNPSFNWGDGLAKGVGSSHQALGRKTPTILNLAWDSQYFWDGRAGSLEQQALMPISSPAEMNMPHDVMIKRLDAVPAYGPLFAHAFPGEAEPINKDNIARAIAVFERRVISGEAPFDRWRKGDERAISASAKRGFVLFNTKGNCAACHSGWNFSDGSFHDIGLPDDDIGRGKILPALTTMQHAFKTVGLRDIARRYPYMHDGSLPTLAAVIDHYDGKFVRRGSLDDFMKPLDLDKAERADLIAFLHTLTSDDKPVAAPVLPR